MAKKEIEAYVVALPSTESRSIKETADIIRELLRKEFGLTLTVKKITRQAHMDLAPGYYGMYR